MKYVRLLKVSFILLLTGLFTTVLNYSLTAEKDSLIHDLPEIPAPEDGRSELYRMIQASKDHSTIVNLQSERLKQEKKESVFPEQKTYQKKETKNSQNVKPVHSATEKPEKITEQLDTREGLVASIVKETVAKEEKAIQAQKSSTITAAKPASSGATLVKKNEKKLSLKSSLPISLSASTGPESFPTNLKPYQPRKYKYQAPAFYRGIYLTTYTARTSKRYQALIQKGKPLGLNTLVVDVQPRVPPESFIRYAKKNGLYLVARVVVFEGGLKTYPASIKHINNVMQQAENAAKAGFEEIQLDYIRFADNLRIKGLTMDKRYRMIAGVLRMSEDRLRPYGVRIGADVFGRIAFNKSDIIGQQVELFSQYMDTLYPMLYPSHFYGDPHRRKDPYGTIFDGTKNSMNRSGETRIIAYIQAFQMAVSLSGLSYTEYIKKQLVAAEKSGSAGYVAWNARNQYGAFFAAMKQAKK